MIVTTHACGRTIVGKVKPRRQTYRKAPRSRAHDGVASTSKRVKQLEAEVQQLRHSAEFHSQRMASLQAELDHCVARMSDLLGGRFR